MNNINKYIIKEIFKINKVTIAVGNKADISMFTTNDNWTFGKEHLLSKSKNSAFFGQKMNHFMPLLYLLYIF